jgi:hypothetical protein
MNNLKAKERKKKEKSNSKEMIVFLGKITSYPKMML